jgi:hypothetical protein
VIIHVDNQEKWAVLCAGDVATVERLDGEPALVVGGFAMSCTNTAAADCYAEAAQRFAHDVAVWETQLVVGTLQEHARTASCSGGPCHTTESCKFFGAHGCNLRVVVAGDPT